MARGAAPGQARQRVLDAAGSLFSERGYSAVTLKDIARALQIRQAALYYHAPGGKEELFTVVSRQTLERHRDGLTEAIAGADENITAQLREAAAWLLGQAPFDLARFVRADLPSLDEAAATELEALSRQALSQPIESALFAAYQRGEVRMIDPPVITHVFLAMVNSLHDVHRFKRTPKDIVAQDVIDTLMQGLRR